MKKQPIFVAVDTNNHKRASEIINATKNYIYGAKFGLEYRDWETDRKSTRLNSSHSAKSRMPSSA